MSESAKYHSSITDERLIREIEKRRMLFDTKDLFYKDNVVKEKEWATLSKTMGLEVDFCKSRWKALRDGFVKAKNAQKEHRYADKLYFLTPFLQSRRNKRFLVSNEDEDSAQGENGDLLAAAAASAEITDTRPPENKTPRRSVSPGPYVSVNPKDVPQSDLDESYHFAMSLVPIMARMDRTTRRQAQVFILNGLGNFEGQL